MNNIEYVESNMDLTSYSFSKNFKGFFESKIGWGNEEYIKYLLEIIFLFVDELQVVSSLNIRMNLKRHAKDNSMSKKYIKCRNFLLENGVIVHRLGDNSIENDFHFNKSIDKSTALNVLLYQTSIAMDSGTLFFVDVNKGVIIYPHDDCGLDFIVEDNKLNLEAIKAKMLKYKDLMTLESLRF